MVVSLLKGPCAGWMWCLRTSRPAALRTRDSLPPPLPQPPREAGAVVTELHAQTRFTSASGPRRDFWKVTELRRP